MKPLPDTFFKFLASEDNAVLLEVTKPESRHRVSYLFANPCALLAAHDAPDLSNLWAQIQEMSGQYYLAGFLAYEVGYFLEEKLYHLRGAGALPLAWFGVFETRIAFDHTTGKLSAPAGFETIEPDVTTVPDFTVCKLQFNIDSTIYKNKVLKIKQHIRNGDTYQVNFTSRYSFRFSGDLGSFYHTLRRRQRVGYNAFIKCNGVTIISCSPELFFEISGDGCITARPMKGTIARGRTTAEDLSQAESLRHDPKNRSENVMIVDLVRNDLGKICEIGSVETTHLFEVEKYETLFQLTSTIKGKLLKNLTFREILSSLFPCGSVTGAPKIRTMEIIRDLENEDRGVYCGAIGFFAPSGEARFSVPIRTITVKDGFGEMGVGSGIVYDSDADQEYSECKLKARFLIEEYPDFSLIETMLWQDGLQRLDGHLDRLQDSALYFDFPCDRKEIVERLRKESARCRPGNKYKVRLLLDRFGQTTIEVSSVLPLEPAHLTIAISTVRTNSQDRFLYHKTTNRRLYDDSYAGYSARGFYDVIFLNERGEVTEGAISNIFIKKGEQFLTPPVSSGALNGIFRRDFLGTNGNALEKALTLDDLKSADAIFLTNAIRGMTQVCL